VGGDAERLDFTSDLFEDDVRPQTGQLRAAPDRRRWHRERRRVSASCWVKEDGVENPCWRA
jgi:hypothetical protein